MPVDPPARRAGSAKPPVAAPPAVEPHISLGIAFLTWLCGWIGGNILGSFVLTASGYGDVKAADRPVWVAALSAVALWIPQLVALFIASQRFASGDPIADYGLRFRPIDLLGIPIGVASQILLLNAVYWPLKALWPEAFSTSKLEQNARDVYDSASGAWVVVLILVIVVAAPFVEELVYRGLLQGAARRTMNDVLAVVLVALFFALIHLRPVEYPGLFAFGLVLGFCALVTNRLGMGIVTHLAFNATALYLVAN